MVINTNIMAQAAANQLGASSQRLSQSLARLSSGSKINSPADDAAGLAVSMNFTAQIGRTNAANDNVANATSFSQTQDGYLQQVSNALNRMSELAVQAQDVTKSDSDRSLYNQEFQTLATYVNNVGTKDFNGVSLFSGNDLNVTSDSEGGTFQMKGISSDFGVSGTTTTSTAVPYAANTQLGQISSALNGNPDGDNVQVEQVNSDLNPNDADSIISTTTIKPTNTINDLVGFFNSTGGDTSASYDSSTGQLSITAAPGFFIGDYGSTIFSNLGLSSNFNTPIAECLDNRLGSSPLTMSATLTSGAATTSTPSSGASDISTADDAKAALTTIKNAISTVASDRAKIGSNMERLNSTSQELSTLANNLSAANSRITDVDVATESTNYAKENILVQTGTAMLAQANALPQSVLKLLG
jgi:flagellin